MTEEYFTKVPDRILEGDWEWSDDNTVGMFLIRLLKKVRFQKQRKWHGFDLAENEFPAGIDSLCNLTHMSKTTVKRCMKCLMSSGDISEKVIPNKFRIIRIAPEWILSGQKCTNKSTNKNADRVTNRGKKCTNRSADRSTPIKDNKKYSPPLREENTAHAPERPDGVGLGAEKTVTVAEIRRFADTVYGGDAYNACDFRRAFINSGTKFPSDWKDIFTRFAAADSKTQVQFLDDVEAGKYLEKWGAAD